VYHRGRYRHGDVLYQSARSTQSHRVAPVREGGRVVDPMKGVWEGGWFYVGKIGG
jgi:hypothetical protein